MNEVNNRDKAFEAVARLLSIPEKQPEKLKKFFKRLEEYNVKGKNLDSVLKKANETIDSVEVEMQHLYGAINAVSEMIADDLTPEQVEQYSQDLLPKEQKK